MEQENSMANVPPKPTGPAYVYNVKMTCEGCAGAINRVLKGFIQAPNQFSISLGAQQVITWGPALPPFDDVTAEIAKTGKLIRSKQHFIEEAQPDYTAKV